MIRRCHLVAFPRPFVQAEQLGLALEEVGSLGAYLTGMVPSPSLVGWGGRVLRSVSPRLGRALQARTLPSLPRERLLSWPWIDVPRSVTAALGWSRLADRLWELDEHVFSRLAARHLGRAQVVHVFEHSGLELLQGARSQGLTTVLHVPSPHPRFTEDTLATSLRRHGLGGTPRGSSDGRQARRVARRCAELEQADLIVANSSFCARTLVESGVSPDRVLTVPLGGAPETSSPFPREDTCGERGLRVLFVGRVAFHKGIHILLEAWRRLDPGPAARLVLAGGADMPVQMIAGAQVEWLGPVSRDEVPRLMRGSDLVVLPSLVDGFGMVVAEALGQGVPVLVSRNVGAADLVEEGATGWIVEADDVEALRARLEWMIADPERLRGRAAACRAASRVATWSAYRERVRQALGRRGL